VNWLIYAALSAIFAGVVAIFGKIGVRGVDSTLATTIRAIIMAAALLAIVLARGTFSQAATIDRRATIFIILSGLAGAASWVCYFRALQLGDALRVAPIDRLSGAVTLSWLFCSCTSERLPPRGSAPRSCW
jgi:bacterial/archaeal transporter family protein